MTVKHEAAQTDNSTTEREELLKQIIKVKTALGDNPQTREVVELLLKKSTEVLHITDSELESL